MPLNAALRAELPELVPNGLLVTRSWLMEQGLARHAVDNLVKSGQLLPLRPGVYMRPGSRLVWQGVVGSLQRMGGSFVV
ncbi:MAG: AbiEi antitoxin N-terminal domain-containing protein, partial [Rhodospirillales bacterium]|nr:AbiEi antitoxin N-terminal domain-containing protein [Rhodospirillales bacterium]